MLDRVLSSKLREQAGSDTYNRFEYQVHWIAYHMIKEYKKGNEFLILCEFHDDMVKGGDAESPESLEFYQIKTSDTKKNWKIKDLLKKDKKTHSFLGFIFYNFMNFNAECSKCHFVSNIGVNNEIATWQSIIEDNKILKDENIELYNQVKELIRTEYNEYSQDEFEIIFDKFIQNTYIYNGDLPLYQYEQIVKGEFADLLGDKQIYVSSSNKILRDIIEDIRKKSKTKIQTPISLNKLKEKKSVSSNIFKDIDCKIDGHIKKDNLYNDIEECLEEFGFNMIYRRRVTRALKNHHTNILNISNSLYIDICNEIEVIIEDKISNCMLELESKQELQNLIIEIKNECKDILNKLSEIDLFLVEALIYEKLLSR